MGMGEKRVNKYEYDKPHNDLEMSVKSLGKELTGHS
jgi:hypothetical protein